MRRTPFASPAPLAIGRGLWQYAGPVEGSATARYKIPAQPVSVEQEIARSRFIAWIGPAATVEEARAFIAQVAAQHSDATHNCWAYLIGPPGSTAQIGLSDDGEPHNTAGRPMLKVLQHCGVGDIAAVVTRYFGGVKLGTGNLARAYSTSVQLALADLVTAEKIAWRHLRLSIEYSLLDPLARQFAAFEVEELSLSFADKVTLELRLPVERYELWLADAMDRASGQLSVEDLP